MSFNNLQLNISHLLSNLRPWLTLFIVVWLLGSLGLGWLVNSLLILVGLLFLAPIVLFFGFRWWIQQNLISDRCPVCGYGVTGLNNTQLQCSNCGEQLFIQERQIQRFTPEGTIDVNAIEVPSQSMEDS
ncbi:hypothetical protein [Calothrix rhizosoleniae]|uniref:hypothetical protein n=1 Tax=Calothrix rhizosoleniae TaxID=888997 RepID=UPI000B49EEAB|nr:hypothetical protein [Calothrix rhizosoleniae]